MTDEPAVPVMARFEEGFGFLRLPVSQIIAASASPGQRRRFRVLALSGKAAALAASLEGWAEHRDAQPRPVEEREAAENAIEAICATLTNLAKADGTSESMAALAAALNSSGRAAHLAKRPSHAARRFREAIDAAPDMPDPYVNLAAVWMIPHPDRPIAWEEEVDRLLEHARELTPGRGKVYYYLGRRCIDRGEWAAAVEHFGRADPHPWALFWHAKALAKLGGEQATMQALQKVDESIRSFPRPDERYAFFLEHCKSQMATADPGPVPNRAFELAIALTSSAADPEHREKAAAFLILYFPSHARGNT